MRCKKCGYTIPDDSDFCQYCGSRIEVLIEQPVVANPSKVGQENFERPSIDEITQSQRYFDSDYGYSPENPIVTSSVQMIGFYLYALRTKDGQRFTWERQPRQHGSTIDAYQLFIDGKPYKTIYFNPHGKDSEYMPSDLVKDMDAYSAAQQGLTLEEYKVKLEEKAEKERADAEKRCRRRRKIRKALVIVLALIVLCSGGYFGIRYGLPYLKYTIAVRDMNNGKAERAVDTFIELGDYKDSKSLATEARYLWAMSLYDENEYLLAKEQFENLKAYKDAKEMIQRCNFELGKQCMADKNYKDAITLLLSVKTENVDDLLAKCYYNYMIEMIAKKEWGPAFVNYQNTQKYDHDHKFDLSQYQYEVFEEYANWKIELGGESDCINAISTAQSLIQTYGETEELLNLQTRAEAALLEAKYQAALALFNPTGYKAAVGKLSEILDYKDSHEKWLEAMYLYVQENKPRFSSPIVGSNSIEERLFRMQNKITYYNYAEELSKNNYKDSKSYYSELTAWKATTIMNNNPDDPDTEMNSITKYDNMCVHVTLRGGPLDGKTKLKYVFTMPDGGALSGVWDFSFEDGTKGAAWCYYEQPQYGSPGTCYVKIYDKTSGKLLASDQIRVTD